MIPASMPARCSLTARQDAAVQELALENKLPYVQLVESAGATCCATASRILCGAATSFAIWRGCPRRITCVTVTHGSSTAGGAYQTGLSDYIVMCAAGPALSGRSAAAQGRYGEIATEEELGGAEMHTSIPASAIISRDDRDALRIAREIMAKLEWDRRQRAVGASSAASRRGRMLGIMAMDHKRPVDMRQ